MSIKERYIPPEIESIFAKLESEQHFDKDREKYNSWLMEHKPHIPRSTRTRWVRAFCSGDYTTETPKWHQKPVEAESLVPDKFSALKSGEYKESREKWGDTIRYANVSCLHIPVGDRALWRLARRIIYEFKPNVFPILNDDFDLEDFNQHSQKPNTSVLDRSNRYSRFIEMTNERIKDVKEIVPKNCTIFVAWGNHENRILRELLNHALVTGSNELQQWYINSYFENLQKAGILWVEGDKRNYLPLTQQFIVGHGRLSRSNEGATAKAYLAKFRHSLSIAVGHSHRQETLWTKTPTAERFCAIAGTLGRLQRNYNNNDFVQHNWGFQLITHPVEGWKGAVVEDIRIYFKNGFYITYWRGKEYSEPATFEYDELLDLMEIGVD